MVPEGGGAMVGEWFNARFRKILSISFLHAFFARFRIESEIGVSKHSVVFSL